ncbi:DNA mismatch repair protein MutT [Clostridium sp.]|uniref:DNA mismatch repair protein MutT n=1 Tax=Clostridium sp. TaxID=1506 RepID=UPI001A6201B5|nr:DNA mismatch repair protein MutT [Clostridium sp.]MBK5240987.1 DNA mismatch repair protein MutT [Clostridium sp.]
MDKVVKCSIIVCDDFNAVLIANRGKSKKSLQKVWSIFSSDIKGKGTVEKSISKAIDKDLKCNIFDITSFKEYAFDSESGDTLKVYTGKVKEYLTPHKDIQSIKWITKSKVDMYEFSSEDKEIILDFFKSRE